MRWKPKPSQRIICLGKGEERGGGASCSPGERSKWAERSLHQDQSPAPASEGWEHPQGPAEALLLLLLHPPKVAARREASCAHQAAMAEIASVRPGFGECREGGFGPITTISPSPPRRSERKRHKAS